MCVFPYFVWFFGVILFLWKMVPLLSNVREGESS